MPELGLESVVSVTGEVVPAEWAALSIQTDGAVDEVLVEVGDDVAAGDVLVRLEPTDAKLELHEAEALLAGVVAQLRRLKAQPRPEGVAAVEEQVEAAEAAVAQAAAERDGLASGIILSDIAQANAEVAAAEAGRKAAQIDYDETRRKVENDVVDEWKEKEAALRLRAAEQNLEASRMSLAYAQRSADPRMEEVEAGVRSAEAQRTVAQAQLRQLEAGAPDEEIALAEVDVARAQVALDEAGLRLERCERRAPFGGTVGMVEIREGEQVRRGDAILTLGDLSTLWVETTDLDEIDVAKVRIGQEVDVTFDAFPERVFSGRVVRINPMAEAGGGGVNYRTIIAVEELAPEIRWGMTAFVDINVGG
ncbi:MAG: efflux RND transporter periplasmic adaptor subunit [Anaerolineae bacterium]|jgi:multidrug resistance efflux pump